MGTCCAVREKEDRDVDLPTPAVRGNAFEKFETSLPFGRTYVDAYVKRVRAAAAKSGGDGSTVTIEALRQTFLTPAWWHLNQEDSRITKLVTSNCFKSKDGLIDVDSLILMGFLHCEGSVNDRSEVLYGVF